MEIRVCVSSKISQSFKGEKIEQRRTHQIVYLNFWGKDKESFGLAVFSQYNSKASIKEKTSILAKFKE